MSDFLLDSTDVLREKFILYRLGQLSRFGRTDIEDWLDQQLCAEVPDCKHEAGKDSICLWCRISNECLFLFDDMQAMTSLFETSLSAVCLKEHTPRLFSWAGVLPFLAGIEDQFQYFVGRDRFVIAKGVSGIYILEMQAVSGDDFDIALVNRPFEQDPILATYALADVLMGEWIRGGPRVEQARSALVGMLQMYVCYERSRAGEDFDRAVAVSEDGKKIIRASWVIVYNPDSKQLFFHRPDWFAGNKLRIDPLKRRLNPEKNLPFPVVGSSDSFVSIATCVKNMIVGREIDAHQVILPVGRKKEPILFVPATQFHGKFPVGVCSVQL